MNTQRIRVIAVCPFLYEGRVLVMSGFDAGSQTHFYRPLGGGVEFGETTTDALQRELREELNQEIENLQLIDILESIFTVNGEMGHEIVYVYNAEFVDRSVYEQPMMVGHEDDGSEFEARWIPLDFFDDKHRLVPSGLAELLSGRANSK